jgi:small subunit ribosomal protein S16
MYEGENLVKIRMKRLGSKKKPFYRLVVCDSRSPRDGRFIEEIGTYDPLKDPGELSVKKDRLDYWVSQGAKPSETLASLFKRDGHL